MVEQRQHLTGPLFILKHSFNKPATGLWLESERMLHPVINEIGVKTQNEVVKKKEVACEDNRPYGNFVSEIMSASSKHQYLIGFPSEHGAPGCSRWMSSSLQ